MGGAFMEDRSVPGQDKSAGCLARLYWMFGGNVLYCFALVHLAQQHPRFPALMDAVCLVVVVSLVYVRYLDIRHCRGMTGEGQPASMADWRRYALCISAVGVAAWAAVRFLIPLL